VIREKKTSGKTTRTKISMDHKETKQMLHAINRSQTVRVSWEHWIKHVKECQDCAKVVKEAMSSEDPRQAFWVIGFQTALDMIEAGELKQIEIENN
jgi:hypothetical protein